MQSPPITQRITYQNGYFLPLVTLPQTTTEVFSFPNDWIWYGLDYVSKKLEIKNIVVSLLPAWWQVEPLIFKTMRHHNAPTIALTTKNLQVLPSLAVEWPIDLLIVTPTQLYEVYPHLLTLKEKPKGILVVHHTHTYFEASFPDVPIFHTLELLPGFSLGVQTTPTYGTTNKFTFALSPFCIWNWNKEQPQPTVTIKDHLPIALTDYPIPFALQALPDDMAESVIPI